jgi:hypothetical protein
MDNDHPVPPEQTAVAEPAPEATPESVPEAAPEAVAAVPDEPASDEAASAESAPAPASEAPASEELASENGQTDGLPKGSIAAVGERLGQRVAQISEAAADRVTHASEVAGKQVSHAGEVAGSRVAHAGEAAGQRVILAGEAAEGTVADAQTRAAKAKRRIVTQAGALAGRIRRTTPAALREKGTRAVQAVRSHRRSAIAGSAIFGIAAARRRGKHSDDEK